MRGSGPDAYPRMHINGFSARDLPKWFSSETGQLLCGGIETIKLTESLLTIGRTGPGGLEMLLVCGDQQDALVREVLSSGRNSGIDMVFLTETKMFDECGICLRQSKSQTDGYLRVHGRQLQLSEITGVLLRLNRNWWPSADFDLKDQMFVYHETVAACYALLDSLTCPVLNRWPLGWWLQDLCYPQRLRAGLGDALSLPCAEPTEEMSPTGRLMPTEASRQEGLESIYRIAGHTIAPPHASERLVNLLSIHEQRLRRWESQQGIHLSRVDFLTNDDLSVYRVETFPLLNEAAAVASSIAHAVVTFMAKAEGVAA